MYEASDLIFSLKTLIEGKGWQLQNKFHYNPWKLSSITLGTENQAIKFC